jgi:hypothetical protein
VAAQPPTRRDPPTPDDAQAGLGAASLAALVAAGTAVGPAALGATGKGALVGAASLPAATAGAIAEAVERALDGFWMQQLAIARREARERIAAARPDWTDAMVDAAAREELAYEDAFRRKSRARWARELPRVMAIPDAAERRRAVEAFLARERRYSEQRYRAIVRRVAARVERERVRDASPLGAYWTMDPRLRTHTPGCVALAGHFWPWSVIDRVHPPLHANCGCRLWSLDEAVRRGWMRADQVPDEADAVRRARELARRIEELHGELSEAELQEASRYALRYPKGTVRGGEFRPRRRYDAGGLLRKHVRRDLRRLLEPPPHAALRDDRETVSVGGRSVSVPWATMWRGTVGGERYFSPPQSTSVYRDRVPVPRAASPAILEDVRQRANELVTGRRAEALKVMRGRIATGEAPVRKGEPVDRLGLLPLLGFRRTATSLTSADGRPAVVDSYRAEDGRLVRVTRGNAADGYTDVLGSEVTKSGLVARALDRPPRSFEEFKADAAAWAERMAARHGRALGLTDIGEDRTLQDSSAYREWDGQLRFGPDVRAAVEAAAAARKRKGGLIDYQAAEMYVAEQVALHEASHAVNVEYEYDFQRPGRRNLEEALTEEASRTLVAGHLKETGQEDVLRWMAQNPDHGYLEGNYRSLRRALASALDRAGVAPEDREAYVMRLKFDVDPNERIQALARDAAASRGTEERSELALITSMLADPGRAPISAPWYPLATLPAEAAALRGDAPSVDIGGGQTLRPGALAEYRAPDGSIWVNSPVTALDRNPDGTWDAQFYSGAGVQFVRGIREGEGLPGLTAAPPEVRGIPEGASVAWARPDGAETRGTVDRVLYSEPGGGWAFEGVTEDGRRAVVTSTSTRGLRRLDAAERSPEGSVPRREPPATPPAVTERSPGAPLEDWSPGRWGKGFVVDGDLVTWATDRDWMNPDHDQASEQMGLELQGKEYGPKITITPDGFATETGDYLDPGMLRAEYPAMTAREAFGVPEDTGVWEPDARDPSEPGAPVDEADGERPAWEVELERRRDAMSSLVRGHGLKWEPDYQRWWERRAIPAMDRSPGRPDTPTSFAPPAGYPGPFQPTDDMWADVLAMRPPTTDPDAAAAWRDGALGALTPEGYKVPPDLTGRAAEEYRAGHRAALARIGAQDADEEFSPGRPVAVSLGQAQRWLNEPPEGAPHKEAPITGSSWTRPWEQTAEEFAADPATWWHGTQWDTMGEGDPGLIHLGDWYTAFEALRARTRYPGLSFIPKKRRVETPRQVWREKRTGAVGDFFGPGGSPAPGYEDRYERVDNPLYREPFEAHPRMVPVRIVGPMASGVRVDTVGDPHSGRMPAESIMRGQLHRGVTPRRGYFYRNEGEGGYEAPDPGHTDPNGGTAYKPVYPVSAVVPSGDWLRSHEDLVRDALARGEDVPDRVLAEYPHLRREQSPGRPETVPAAAKRQALIDSAIGAGVHYDTEQALRSGAALTPEQEEHARALDAAIADAPPLGRPRVLWRGQDAPYAEGPQPAWLSTTTDPDVADAYGPPLKVHVPAGVRAVDMTRIDDPEGYSRMSDEVLLPRGLTLTRRPDGDLDVSPPSREASPGRPDRRPSVIDWFPGSYAKGWVEADGRVVIWTTDMTEYGGMGVPEHGSTDDEGRPVVRDYAGRSERVAEKVASGAEAISIWPDGTVFSPYADDGVPSERAARAVRAVLGSEVRPARPNREASPGRPGGPRTAPDESHGARLYHGAHTAFRGFEAGQATYLAPDPEQARVFAERFGLLPSPDARVIPVDAPPGRAKDVAAAVDAAIARDDDPQDALDAEIATARGEGYRYVTYDHPSGVEGEPDFTATVSLHPNEDLGVPLSAYEESPGRPVPLEGRAADRATRTLKPRAGPERDAVEYYEYQGYDVNPYLRAGMPDDWAGPPGDLYDDERDRQWTERELVGGVDAAMSHNRTPEPVRVWRGIAGFPWDEFGAAPGDYRALVGREFADGGYMSTGFDRTTASRRAAHDPGLPDDNVVLRLDVPAGTPAVHVAGITKPGVETELLLGRGLRFRVTGIGAFEDTDWRGQRVTRPVVEAEVLPQGREASPGRPETTATEDDLFRANNAERLPPDQDAALHRYADDPGKLTDEQRASLLALVDSHPLPGSIRATRKARRGELDGLRPGDEFAEHRFASASVGVSWGIGVGDDNGELRFTIPAGTPAYYNPASYGTESEVILPPGARFRVTGERRLGERRILDAELLGVDRADPLRARLERAERDLWRARHGRGDEEAAGAAARQAAAAMGERSPGRPDPDPDSPLGRRFVESLQGEFGPGLRARVTDVEAGAYGTIAEGEVVDPARSDAPVGTFRRRLTRENGRLVVSKDQLWLDPRYRHKGFAAEQDAESMRRWRELGVDRVEVDTDEDGGYVWARLGYRLDADRHLAETGQTEGQLLENTPGFETAPGTPDEVRRAYLYQVLEGAFHDEERTAELDEREQRPAPTDERLREVLDMVVRGELRDVGDVAALPDGRALLSDTHWSGYKSLAPAREESPATPRRWLAWHGTSADAAAAIGAGGFRPGADGEVWTTQNRGEAGGYGMEVVPVEVTAINPYIARMDRLPGENLSWTAARDAGYDAYVIEDAPGGATIISFDPSRVRTREESSGRPDLGDRPDVAGRVVDAARRGGATIDPATGTEPSEGFAVALEGHSSITPDAEFFSGPPGRERGRAILRAWLREHRAALAEGTHIGVWHDVAHREVVLDPVDVFPSDAREEAIAAGRERDQQSIYDLKAGVEIPTGGTGGR